MTVRELIERLKTIEPDQLVVMASDSEENSHSPLMDFWVGAYKAETPTSGYVGLMELTDEDLEEGYTEDDLMEDGEDAVIFVPSR